jgi:hypothetical protein
MVKLLSFYLFEQLYSHIVTSLNKLMNDRLPGYTFTHSLTIICPPCQSVLSQSNMCLSLLINLTLESVHFYTCNSYYSLLDRLDTQNLTYENSKMNHLPISKKIIDILLGYKGLIYAIETDAKMQKLPMSSIVNIDQSRMMVKFSFLEHSVKYNFNKLRDSIKNMVVTPLILKYLGILALPVKSKENTVYLKKLKKYMQNSAGQSTVFSERFSDVLMTIMKDVFSKTPYTLY